MAANLTSRLDKLEFAARAFNKSPARIVRVIVAEGEEQEAYSRAAKIGLNTSPESKDLLIIRLIYRPKPKEIEATAPAPLATTH